MNTTSTGRISLLNAAAILCLSLLLSAGGGGSDDSQDRTNLTVTFTNISEPSQLEGVSVVLHGADNRSIEQVLQPDNNGVVDFGDIDRSRVSFSVIEEVITEGGGSSFSINTTLDAPNMPYFLRARFGDNPGWTPYAAAFCDDPVQVQGRITNMPENIDLIWIDGMASPLDFDSPPFGFDAEDVPAENEVFPFYVCPLAFGVDNFYLVAIASSGSSSELELIAHSPRMYLDSETNVYVFDLSQRPFTIPITNTTTSELYFSSATDVLLGRIIGDSSFSDSGEYITMLDLPAEHYAFSAYESFWGAEKSLTITRFMDQLPESLIFNPPAFSLSNDIQVNEATRTLSWNLQNASSVDFMTIDLTHSFIGAASWTIRLNPNTSSLTLPDLPEHIDVYLRSDNLRDCTWSIGDYSNVSGFDNYLEAFNDFNRSESLFDAYMSLGEEVSIRYQPNPRPVF